jgi:hypothetical protein
MKSETKQKYSDAIDFMDRWYSYITTQVLNLGTPIEDEVFCPTSCVTILDGEIKLFINPSFMNPKGPDDYSFILAHESMHVLLGHLSVMDNFDDKRRFNIATDCIINDFLDAYNIMYSDTLMEGVMRGENVVGWDCAYSSLEDVYNAIPEEYHDGGDGEGDSLDDHNWQFTDASGNPISGDEAGKILKDAVMKGFDHLSDEIKDAVFENNADVADEVKDSRPTNGWSNDAGMPRNEIELDDDISLNWAELINKITPDTFGSGHESLSFDRSFARPNKKLIGSYPKIVLPSIFHKGGGVGDNKKTENTYVLALDCSGSIDQREQQRLMKLAKSLPKQKIKLFCVTFSTYVREFDPDVKNNIVASGGTSFTCIQQWIKQKVVPEVGHYPKAIIVMTDGEAMLSDTTDEELKNWHWLLVDNPWAYGPQNQTSDSRVNRICSDQIYQLKDFIA